MRFGVLGPLAVWAADGTPITVPELKVRALLAALLVDPGQVVSTDRLAEFLWPEHPPANLAGSIQTRVSRLRRAVGADLVEHRAPGYRLAVDPSDVDTGRFASLTARARELADAGATSTAPAARADSARAPSDVRTDRDPAAADAARAATDATSDAGANRDPDAVAGLRTRRDLLAEALGLWRGDPFADFADAPLARPAITRLAQQRLLTLEDFAESRLQLGEAPALAAELRELVDANPRRERLRAIHMRALYLAGRHSEALDGYHELRRHLGDELGLDPSPELTDLYGRMLRHDQPTRFTGTTPDEDTAPSASHTTAVAAPAADTAPPAAQPVEVRSPATDAALSAMDAESAADAAPTAAAALDTAPPEPAARGNLPRPLTALIGRDRELSMLDELVREHRLVTLTGFGGVGKTSLAIAAARQASPAVDGSWLIELAALPETATAAQLAVTVADALGILDDQHAAASHRDPVARLAEALRPKHCRLLLDNCEHVVGAVAEIAETLLRAAPRLSILATSQEPLGIAGEQLVPVPPLRPEAAAALFTARARGAVPGFTVTDAAALAAICERLDGIPLALELAANRVRVLGLRELEQRLRDRFGLLTAGRRDAPARQRTLRAMLDWSWELLTAAERIVLRRLAVHAEGCTLAAAEAVCATDGVRSDEVLDLLARLVDRSLVQTGHTATGPRYRLLESVAAYCVERSRAADDLEPARRAHARYYLDLAENLDARLRGAGQADALRSLDDESANFRLAFDTAVAPGVGRADADRGDTRQYGPGQATAATGGPPSPIEPTLTEPQPAGPGPALRLVTALSWYWFLRGRLTEPKRMLAAALAASGPDDPRHARATVVQHALRLLSGDTDLSTGELSAAADHGFAAADDPGPRARAQWFLAHALTYFGDSKLAERLLDQALAVFTELDDCWGHAAVVYSRAEIRYDRGELSVAREQGRRALELFDESGDGWGRSQAATLLGRLAEVAGDYRQAATRHQAALDAATPLGLWTAVSISHSELGRIALLAGDLARAEQSHERARRIAVEHADRPGHEYAELGLAIGARRQARFDDAEERLLRWLGWNRELGTDFGLALILAELGFIAEQRGDEATALQWQREGLTAARRTGNPRAEALALEGLAGAHSLAGDHERAARLLGTATAVRGALGAPLPPAERGDVDRVTARLRAALGESRLNDLLAKGAAIPLDASELTD